MRISLGLVMGVIKFLDKSGKQLFKLIGGSSLSPSSRNLEDLKKKDLPTRTMNEEGFIVHEITW